jgi:hypothetical protein
MKIENETAWDSAKLRKFLFACKQELDKVEGKLPHWQVKNLKVKVVYIKFKDRDYYDGYAYYNGTFMRLRVPRPCIVKTLDLKRLAHLFFHESYHIRGYLHRQMNDNYEYEFIHKGFESKKLEPITAIQVVEEVKPKPAPVDKVEKKLDIARRRLVKAENMVKRATKLVKKWKSKVRYYEKRRGEFNETNIPN